jgi:anaerobic ribonucleoside-triphosphate reductase
MSSKFLLFHAFDAFLCYIFWQSVTPHILLKVLWCYASHVSDVTGYMCTMPLSCINSCDFPVEMFNKCVIITADVSHRCQSSWVKLLF